MRGSYTRAFWAKVQKGTADECWPWIGYRKDSGHGLTQLQGVPMHASRKAWILTHGPIEGRLCVNHKCNNALCCNPVHMYLGTRAQNMGDRFGTDGVTLVSKRRAATGRSRGRPSKLSMAEKHELRRYREAGTSIARLAAMWKVSTTRVYGILAEMRERLGPEQLPKEKQHLARQHLFSSTNPAANRERT